MAAVCLSTLLSAAAAQECGPKFSGGLDDGGFHREVIHRDGVLYISVGSGGAGALLMIDVDGGPFRGVLSQVDIASTVRAVALKDNIAVCATEYDGLVLVDVQDPRNPVLRGSVDAGGAIRDVAVSGEYIAVSVDDVEDWIKFYSLADVDAPELVSELPLSTRAYDVEFAEQNYLLVACDREGIRVVDVHDIRSPSFVGVLDTPGRAYDIDVVGTTAVIADNSEGLHIVDVSSPSSPLILGTLKLEENVARVRLHGAHVWAVDIDGAHVIDIRDPTHPTRVSTVPEGGLNDVVLAGDWMYQALQNRGLAVFENSSPAGLRKVTEFDTPGLAMAVASDGGLLYVADGHEGMHIVDPSGLEPAFLANVPSAAELQQVEYSDGYVYCLGPGSGVIVVNVEDSANPIVEGILQTDTSRRIRMYGSIGYLWGTYNGFAIADFQSHSEPVWLGSYSEQVTINDLRVVGDHAYFGGPGGFSSKEFGIVDISVPESPNLISELSMPTRIKTLDVAYPYVFALVDAYEQELYVIDVSDVQNPTVVNTVSVPPSSGPIHIVGDYAYLQGRSTYVLDVSNPFDIRGLGSTGGPGTIRSLNIYEGQLLIAASGSVRVLDGSSCAWSGCIADWNNNDEVNTIDVLQFLNAWSARMASADLDRNRVVDTRDVVQYLNAWAAGCP
jgi:hypothetical protein